jgi:hypothetical protein
MAEVGAPQAVELLIGVIFGDHGLLEPLEAEIVHRIGSIESRSQVFDFDITDYYEDEMGPGLRRIFYSFTDLIDPGRIVEVKLATNLIEKEFEEAGRRRVNLDPGYMDFYKLVLASNKYLGQKIYMGKGVYADPTLYYDKGWKPYDWGFPDFKSGRYSAFLIDVRRAYKAKIRSGACPRPEATA